MAQWVLKANSEIIPGRAFHYLQVVELNLSIELNKRELFDELVKKKWGSSTKPHENSEVKNNEQDYEEYQDEI